MYCEKCYGTTKVVSTLKSSGTVRRYRRCKECNYSFLTEETALAVVKSHYHREETSKDNPNKSVDNQHFDTDHKKMSVGLPS